MSGLPSPLSDITNAKAYWYPILLISQYDNRQSGWWRLGYQLDDDITGWCELGCLDDGILGDVS